MRNCGCCGGKCEGVQLTELSRRAFLGHVAAGIAEPLTDNQQLALAGYPAAVLRQQSLADGLGQTGAVGNRPAQQGLGVELVDVLPAGTRTPRKGEAEFPQRDLQLGCNDEHLLVYRFVGSSGHFVAIVIHGDSCQPGAAVGGILAGDARPAQLVGAGADGPRDCFDGQIAE